MSSDVLVAVGSGIIGAISLFSLLGLFRIATPDGLSSAARRLEPISAPDAHGPTGQLPHSLASTKKRTGRLTVTKLLRYARWSITPWVFHSIGIAISCVILCFVAPYTNSVTHVMCALAGPGLMLSGLRFCVERRSNKFDADYPQFLMSVVGLLKTGMTATQALDTAARGLEAESLVRQEVLLLIERIKVGILEEESISAFGEDILHPEIELFVQALLLSHRIGGNLSDTLERLSRQVRKRQYFKSSAVSAVAQQRGSLVVIISILVLLECYMAMVAPRLVLDGLQSEVGWQVWQVCIALVIVGFVWARRVTSIKV